MHKKIIHGGYAGYGHNNYNIVFFLPFLVFIAFLLSAALSFASVDLNEGIGISPDSGAPPVAPAAPSEAGSKDNGPGVKQIKRIVILPFENLSNNPEAPRIILELIKARLENGSRITIVSPEEVEEFLVKRRIRYTGGVTRLNIREMGKLLQADAVLAGSILLYTGWETGNADQAQDSSTVSVGLAARLINTRDGEILWADVVSYAGNDFAGLLDIGAITSADELSRRAVTEFFKDLDNGFTERNISLPPFEVAEVYSLNPSARAGEAIGIKVKILPIKEEAATVRAVLADQDIALVREEDNIYEGVLRVPEEEGVHTFDIIAVDKSRKEYVAGAAGKIVVDNTAPVLTLNLSRRMFSSKKKDFILFTPKLKSIDNVEEWAIEIVDGKGKKVRSDKGFNSLPKGLIWKGETDKGFFVDDGEYTYRFIVRDNAGNETVMSDLVTVKNSPPSVKVEVTLEDNRIIFNLIKESKDTIKTWKLTMLDKGGKTIKIFSGEGILPEKVEYPLADDFDMTSISYSMMATDEVGNAFNLTSLIPSRLFRKIPFAEARKSNSSNSLEDF